MSGSPSMKDVAAHARVSLGTVSNVLNRPEVVGRRTRERVWPRSPSSGSCATSRPASCAAGGSRTLAYVVLDTGNPFFTDVAQGVQEAADAARPRGLPLQQRAGRARASGLPRPPRAAAGRRACSSRRSTGPTRGSRCSPAAARPVVMVDRAPPPTTARSSSTTSRAASSPRATSRRRPPAHRVRGRARVASPRSPTGSPVPARPRRSRLDAGRPRSSRAPRRSTIAEGRSRGRAPRRRCPPAASDGRVLRQRPARPRAAAEAVRQGLRVPEDLAIVGYDDIVFAEAAAVPLTSVRQPRQQIGRTAAEMLIEEARERGGSTNTGRWCSARAGRARVQHRLPTGRTGWPDEDRPVRHLPGRRAVPRRRPGHGARCWSGSGHEVVFPQAQTCCGQMHINTGYQDEALPLVRHHVEVFEPYEVVVAPSGLVRGVGAPPARVVARRAGDEALAERAEAVAATTYELSELLVDVLGVDGRRRVLPAPGHLPPDLPLAAACCGWATSRCGCCATCAA